VEKITIDKATFDILDVTPILNRKIVTSESMNGSMRAKVFDSRLSLSVTFDEMFENQKEQLDDILTKNSFLVKWNNEEYYMVVADEQVSYGEVDYDLVGNVIYSGIKLLLTEVVPDRQVNSV